MIRSSVESLGTSESRWSTSAALRNVASRTLDQLLGGARRMIVIAPHPDDEVLGVGGAMAQAACAGVEVQVIAVTEGEASHPALKPADLSRIRAEERARALQQLGLSRAAVHRLGFPDGAVATRTPHLARMLIDRLRADDVVFCPWRHDGHPDHEAVTAAVLEVHGHYRFRVLEYPVWAWHWRQPDQLPLARAERIWLSAEVWARKAAAIQSFKSQITDDLGPPILDSGVLQHFGRSFETFFHG